MQFTVSVELPPERDLVFQLPTDISAPGHVREIAWAPVAGATAAEVTSAILTLSSARADETFPDVPVIDASPHRDVTVPPGRHVSAIGLSAEPQTGQRLTLSLPSVRGGFEAPIFASTAVSNGAMAPDSPERATLANGLFRLPRPVSGEKIRLSMVTGDKITNFNPVAFSLSKVNLQTSTPPRNVKVLGPDKTLLWESPELPIGGAPAEVDFRVPLEIALNASLNDPRAAITVSGDAPSRVYLAFGTIHGAFLRVEDGILATEVAGGPARLGLASPLASEQPASAVADLTVTYAGLRVLETVSDTVPPGPAFAEGPVVGASPALHIFPPEALSGIKPAKVAILGRAPEDCELSLEFVPVVGGTAGPPVGPPAVLALTASQEIALHWVDVPAGIVLANSMGLQARANRGRFYWAANEEHPIVRVAIFDPDPGGRSLRMGNTSITTVTGEKQYFPKFSFPVADLRNGFPTLDSELFLTVELSDLTLRYAR